MTSLSIKPEFPALLQSTPFVEAASLGRNAWWRYLLCIALIAVLSFVLTFAMLLGFAAWIAADFGAAFGAVAENIEPYLAHYPLLAFVQLTSSIVILLLVAAPLIVLLHRRRWTTLLTGRARFHWRGFLASFGIAAGLLAAVLALQWAISPESIQFRPNWQSWLRFLPVVLVLIPLQTLAEEVVFRGYVLQGVAAATRLAILRLLVPAALFFVVHLWNPEVVVLGYWAVADYALISLYLTFLAIRGNGLEYAWGMHLATNLFLSLAVTLSPGSLETPAPLAINLYELGGASFALFFAVYPLHYWLLFRGTLAGAAEQA